MPCGCKSRLRDLNYVREIAEKYSKVEKKTIVIFRRNGHYDFADEEYAKDFVEVQRIPFN
jgi:hypothetical protein